MPATDWVKLDTAVLGDFAKVLKCVEHGANTAKEHEKHFGKTSTDQKLAADKLWYKMQKGFQEIWHRAEYAGAQPGKKGEVGLLFQKMGWLSKYAKPSLGEIWVVSVVYEDNKIFKKPNSGDPGIDKDYTDFLEMLNKPSGDKGPLHLFMEAHNVKSLFSVGPVGNVATNKKREISWLELIAKTGWTPTYGAWTFQNPITIDSSYTGSNNKPIPGGVLEHWGGKNINKFDLTEAKFS